MTSGTSDTGMRWSPAACVRHGSICRMRRWCGRTCMRLGWGRCAFRSASPSRRLSVPDADGLPLRENAAAQIVLGDAARHALLEQAHRIIGADIGTLQSSGWYSEDWLVRVFRDAPAQFDHAFDRWRELFRAADSQLAQAQTELRRARNKDDQDRAQGRQIEAMRQRNLLLRINTRSEESDFYPYRYLASEGFLPGTISPLCLSAHGYHDLVVASTSPAHASSPSASSLQAI